MNRKHYEFTDDQDKLFMSVEELMNQMEREREFQASISASDPRHWEMFRVSDDWIDIYWGGYEYSYDMRSLQGPEDLLGLIAHVGKKTWEHTTGFRIAALVEAIARRKGWEIF